PPPPLTHLCVFRVFRRSAMMRPLQLTPIPIPAMKTLLRFRGWLMLGLFVSSLASSSTLAATAKELWTTKLPGDASWHQLTGLGTLVVGTSEAIASYDPDTGQQLWQRAEFKKTSPFNAREIPGTP